MNKMRMVKWIFPNINNIAEDTKFTQEIHPMYYNYGVAS